MSTLETLGLDKIYRRVLVLFETGRVKLTDWLYEIVLVIVVEDSALL